MVAMTSAVVKATHLPVTVKTRLGWDDNTKNVYEVAERLQDVGIQALTIHGRTRAQMYKGEADWQLIREIRKNPRIKIPIFGNGDIDSPQKAAEWRMEYEVDGMMIGRAAIGYPWIFREIKHYFKTGEILEPPTIAERMDAVRKHFYGALKWKGNKLGVLEMRPHYASYLRGLSHVKDFRTRLVSTENIQEIEQVFRDIEVFYAMEMQTA